jgi:uncharacterized membrane protein YhhN
MNRYWLTWLLIGLALLSTASSVLGFTVLHYICKPMTMLVAIIVVATNAYQTHPKASFRSFLLAALGFSLAGDVFLMLPGHFFILGLAAFLIAHLFYIALFLQAIPWFPSPVALLATLGFGSAMYAWVWPGLPDPVLKIAVAAYITVISMMAAQAIGRARVVRDLKATAVALGACVFLLSDSLIAINRFVHELPLISLWVLSSYYIAQILIVYNTVPGSELARYSDSRSIRH